MTVTPFIAFDKIEIDYVMKNELKLLHSQDAKKGLSDMEWIEEFYEFLQGKLPDGMEIQRGHQPKMSAKKAFSVIWYLQEHLSVFPDNIEKCYNCDGLYDTNCSGYHDDKTDRHYCDTCEHLAPYPKD